MNLSAFAQNEQKVKANYNYLLYLPKDYVTTTKAYPLMIYLGGGSQRGTDLNKLKTFGPPNLIAKGQDFDFIIVSPQCPEGKTWTSEKWYDSLAIALIPKYRIDSNRIYVTGISIGGYGTWQAAMDYPDKFAAIIPLCGGINDSDTANISKIKHLPIWTFHGTADNMISIAQTERIYKKLKGLKSQIRFTTIKNGGHGIQYLYEDPKIYQWMLKQRRSNW
ncbi:carboxylesterase family protein [Pedobacter cryoconitis]|uniref:Dienelactone hydrolase family protein n=1 Tax=Pedobacter cryoconitis TaxID=188932 RepID=A0A327S8G3_9SPHI|nr:prolyl oligopeptidase family serine peptidase [Pedobacter cryoconitis]RAJ24632.1 dienelactone hydrolase family protein [Pedobacter cryoconitis]